MMDTASLLSRTESIGTVPTSAAQIFGLINDPKATAGDFERVIRPDVALTANLLRCANSAYYRATREITSVRDAIARMGLRRIFEVAASSSFASKIPSQLVGYGMPADVYWGHSVATAVLADRIGRKAGFTYPDLAFTAGLLHDIGKIVIATYLAGPDADPNTEAPAMHTILAERETLGLDHAQLGEALAQKWSLPKDIIAGCRWHHAPLDAPTATLRSLAAVVQVADAAAHTGVVPGEPLTMAEHAPLQPETLEFLGLEVEEVPGIVEAAKPEIERTRELLASLGKH